MTKNNDSLIEKLRGIFVTTEVFELKLKNVIDKITPMERVVYGALSLMATTVLLAILYGVIKK